MESIQPRSSLDPPCGPASDTSGLGASDPGEPTSVGAAEAPSAEISAGTTGPAAAVSIDGGASGMYSSRNGSNTCSLNVS